MRRWLRAMNASPSPISTAFGPDRAWAGRPRDSKGDRVGIAMRNCPSWILVYMAMFKAGGVATLLNGWWEAARDGACDPADRARS